MAIRRRTTEKHPHPVWEKLVAAYNIVEIEGFVFGCTDDELIEATKSKNPVISVHCIEAVECDAKEEFNYLHFFDENNWLKKVSAARFFNASLKLISHVPGDEYLFRVHEIDSTNGQLSFHEAKQFKHEGILLGAMVLCHCSHNCQPSVIVSASITSTTPDRSQCRRHHAGECKHHIDGSLDIHS